MQAAAKRALRQRMNLSDMDVPVVGVVTRLTHQKGIHLIKHAAFRTLERGGQFVLLGSAPDPRVQVRAPRCCIAFSCYFHTCTLAVFCFLVHGEGRL